VIGIREYTAHAKREYLMDKDIFKDTLAALEEAELPFDITGVVVFGSRAKGKATPHSDIDLLIVADGINQRRHRRVEEIISIKRYLKGLPADILLLTRQEVKSNFRNHNPLFLDIAEDGIIVIDKDKFLENLMEETIEYIKQKGIKKLKEGWVFAVKPGVPTYLSRVSNKDFSLAMLKDGERDFLIGQKLLIDGFYDKAVYHFQQSVEKCIKSILIAMGIFQKTHFVGEILRASLKETEISDDWKNQLLEAAEISEGIEPEVSLSRYPSIMEDTLWLPFEEYEKEDADMAMEKGNKVLSIAKKFVDDWFSQKPIFFGENGFLN
jgi:HEPN domain-containing protein/predicted nucleotidyltransferase